MIVDTSALLAYFDASEPAHKAVSAAIESSDELLVVSPYVLAELDYLVLSRHGIQAEQAAQRQIHLAHLVDVESVTEATKLHHLGLAQGLWHARRKARPISTRNLAIRRERGQWA